MEKKYKRTFRRLSINLLITQALLIIAMVPLVWAAIDNPTTQIVTASAITFALQFMVFMLYVALRRFVFIVRELREEMDSLQKKK